MQVSSVAVIGSGRLGLSLAGRLGEVGLHCSLVRGRRPVASAARRRMAHVAVWDTWERPGATTLPAVVVVAVPDPAIREVATLIAGSNMSGRVVLHTSGLLAADELEACRTAGAAVGSWHPLQSFPPDVTGDLWTGTACAIEGDETAVETGFVLADRLGMLPWRIAAEAKPLYHAAAAVAGNLTFLLVAEARELLARCGLERSRHPDPLAPLVATATAAALRADPSGGLTGPIARRDREAIRRHLQALPPHLAEVYAVLARTVLQDDASNWLD